MRFFSCRTLSATKAFNFLSMHFLHENTVLLLLVLSPLCSPALEVCRWICVLCILCRGLFYPLQDRCVPNLQFYLPVIQIFDLFFYNLTPSKTGSTFPIFCSRECRNVHKREWIKKNRIKNAESDVQNIYTTFYNNTNNQKR